MAVDGLKCKECGASYELEARYYCEECFGPLEVAYDHSTMDPEGTRRRIQAGPASIWRYAVRLVWDSRLRSPPWPLRPSRWGATRRRGSRTSSTASPS